jgi:hypothetical protein
MTLALPDICVSLSSEDGRSDGPRYREWCAENLMPSGKFDYITPNDLWSMRCGVLHNGRFGDLKHSVSRVIFTPRDGGQFENCLVNDSYLYGAVQFCRNFTQLVHAWAEKHHTDEQVKVNMPRLMQYRTDVPGAVKGLVIA